MELSYINFQGNRSQIKVCIIGQGFVGLALAEAICAAGFTVVGVENDERRLDLIKRGVSPVETVTSAVLREMQSKGQYSVSPNMAEVSEARIVILTVPTPLDSEGNPDLSSLISACEMLSIYIAQGTLVVNESTSFAGTLREIVMPNVLEKSEAKKIYFACSPERVNPGDGFYGIRNTPRVVSGIGEVAQSLVTDFYTCFVTQVNCVSTPEVAEMSKLLENSFRLVNISLINEISDYCRDRGIPVREVISAASTKPFGFSAFYPSLGAGGHCIPIDPKYLLHDAARIGSKLRLLTTAAQRNSARAFEAANFAEKLLGTFKDKKVLIFGVTYKPGVSDTRETPAEYLFEYIESAGAIVKWFDENVDQWHSREKANLDLDHFDLILVTMVHNQKGIQMMFGCSSSSVVIDFTGSLDGYPSVIQY